MQMCGELIPEEFVMHTAKDLPAGLHPYTLIAGTVPNTHLSDFTVNIENLFSSGFSVHCGLVLETGRSFQLHTRVQLSPQHCQHIVNPVYIWTSKEKETLFAILCEPQLPFCSASQPIRQNQKSTSLALFLFPMNAGSDDAEVKTTFIDDGSKLLVWDGAQVTILTFSPVVNQ